MAPPPGFKGKPKTGGAKATDEMKNLLETDDFPADGGISDLLGGGMPN